MPLVDPAELEILAEALGTLNEGFPRTGTGVSRQDAERISAVLQEVARRMHDNFPYHDPLYAGQMLKPPHPVARLAYALSLWINPNNHAIDGGRASSAMEKECVGELASMLGMPGALGHLCGGGTMANLEALWAAGRLSPGAVVASTQAHYTHERISAVLGLRFEQIPADPAGRMDLAALRARLRQGGVGTVVATLGTTAVGAVDRLAEVLALGKEFGVRVHVDAAYGGYFRLASRLDEGTAEQFACTGEADSVVVDPHKHGLQPYGCGAVLFRDPAVSELYRHDSPYTYYSSADLHLGEISLECSRPGASAVALWATQRLLPLVSGGEFATRLDRSLQAAESLWRRIADSRTYLALMPPELDIVVFAVAADTAAEAGRRAQAVFREAARQDLHLALVDLPTAMVAPHRPERLAADAGGSVTCLRSCLMKPEHLERLDELWRILETVGGKAGRSST